MRIVITGANSAVGQAILRAGLARQAAADELGIPLTGLDELIRASVASSGQRTTGA